MSFTISSSHGIFRSENNTIMAALNGLGESQQVSELVVSKYHRRIEQKFSKFDAWNGYRGAYGTGM